MNTIYIVRAEQLEAALLLLLLFGAQVEVSQLPDTAPPCMALALEFQCTGADMTN